MLHYLLLRLKQGVSVPAVAAKAREILGKLPGELAGVRRVEVLENAVDREDNYDILIKMELASSALLSQYLSHPRHKEFIALAAPMVESKVSFDEESATN